MISGRGIKATFGLGTKKKKRKEIIGIATDVSETGGLFFFILAKIPKNHGFRSKFQNSIKIVLVDEFHRNRCQNEGLGLNFQEKL